MAELPVLHLRRLGHLTRCSTFTGYRGGSVAFRPLFTEGLAFRNIILAAQFNIQQKLVQKHIYADLGEKNTPFFNIGEDVALGQVRKVFSKFLKF